MNSEVNLGAMKLGWEARWPNANNPDPVVYISTPTARFDMPANHARVISVLLREMADQADAETAKGGI